MVRIRIRIQNLPQASSGSGHGYETFVSDPQHRENDSKIYIFTKKCVFCVYNFLFDSR